MVAPGQRFCFFDAFGTLIYAEPNAAEVYHKLGSRHGDTRSLVEIRAAIKRQLAEAFGPQVAAATSPAVELQRWTTVVKNIFGHMANWRSLFDELWYYFSRPEHWRVFDDVGESIHSLQASGITPGIASNFDSRLHVICDGLQPLNDMNLVIVSAELGWRKPSPEFFQAIRERCDRPASHLWMVGDDWEFDAQPANKCGWQAVHLDRSQSAPIQRLAHGVISIQSLRLLPEIVLA